MKRFADSMSANGQLAKAKGDDAMYLLMLQGVATAYSWIGERSQTVSISKDIAKQAIKLDPDEADPNVQLVYDMALCGIAENDPSCRDQRIAEWVAAVTRAKERDYPDFPGRALCLAKYLDESLARSGNHTFYDHAADALLSDALLATTEFRKPYQIAAVWEYMLKSRSVE